MADTAAADASRVLALVFTDLADSTGLKRRLGDRPAGALIARHQDLVRRLATNGHGREVDAAGDGFFLTFDTPSAGAAFALRLQRAHAEDAELPAVRVGIHLGEVTDRAMWVGGAASGKVEGLAVDVAARIQSLAQPGQVLLSRAAFDSARQRLRSDEVDGEIAWRAHGAYLLQGLDEPIEIGEVGLTGQAQLRAPPDSDKAKRAVSAGEELTLGWRPAVGLAIPGREHWRLVEQLGSGAIGEVWLAKHEKTHAKRVFKFCFEAERVRGLRREVVLLRLLRERLGERPDIAQVLDWEFDRPPFFIETAYTEAGDLLQWAKERGGIAAVPLDTRLDIVAQAARALAAAHGAGVLHKDLKPSNLLINHADSTGRPHVCLTDFGIGLVTSREALSAAGVTMAGLTETLLSSSTSTGAGTRLYMAPEVIEGKPASAASDVYALGVLLYQMVVGDFSRSVAPGWQRDVTDEVLEEDIAACVDGRPEKRIGNAADLADRLDRIAGRRRERAESRDRVARLERTNRRRRRLVAIAVAAAVIAVVGGALWSLQRRLAGERAHAERVRWAREEALPEIRRLSDRGEFDAAVALAEEAERYIATDPVLVELWRFISAPSDITSDPPGAEVYFSQYDGEADWRHLGTTPLEDLRLPRGVHRWRFEKAGYETVERVREAPEKAFLQVSQESTGGAASPDSPDFSWLLPFHVALAPTGNTPEGKVPVPGGSFPINLASQGGRTSAVPLDPFFIDRYEVTNRAFQEFVDAGSYGDSKRWRHPFVEGGRALSFAEAMARLRDETGRPGPAGWRLGSHPSEEAGHPVRGVSWYEAAAYCEWRGDGLPTLAHWARAALDPLEQGSPVSHAVVPASNLAGVAPAPVGEYQGLGPYGTYDMAGNVKEWAWNETEDGRRVTLGGGWSEPAYMFHAVDAAAPLARNPEQGFRCMRVAGEIPEAVAAPFVRSGFDPRGQRPVSDDVFAILARRFAYEPRPLAAVVERREKLPEWTRERVTFDASYGDERVIVHLFLPDSVTPPFQAILFWPGGGAQWMRSSEELDFDIDVLSDYIRGGRAVIYPVYKGTYERGPQLADARGMRMQDLERTIEYLETRPDIDLERLAYLGFSWGAGAGAYLVSERAQSRLKALVLIAGGLWAGLPPPELNQANYAAHVKTPVLMINGRYDNIFPLETHVVPLFELFGAPREHKRLALADAGHWGFPKSFVLREALDWLDRYLGPVTKTPPGSSLATGGS